MPPSPDPSSDAGFVPLYEELKVLARRVLSRENRNHPLQPTALVHEAYLRLGPAGAGTFDGRAHFLAVAAAAMRRILVDYARARATAKRGGGWTRIDLDEQLSLDDHGLDEAIAVDAALSRLATIDAHAAAIVQMQFFGGMTQAEIAEELGRSERWVRERWAFARARLREELEG